MNEPKYLRRFKKKEDEFYQGIRTLPRGETHASSLTCGVTYNYCRSRKPIIQQWQLRNILHSCHGIPKHCLPCDIFCQRCRYAALVLQIWVILVHFVWRLNQRMHMLVAHYHASQFDNLFNLLWRIRPHRKSQQNRVLKKSNHYWHHCKHVAFYITLCNHWVI